MSLWIWVCTRSRACILLSQTHAGGTRNGVCNWQKGGSVEDRVGSMNGWVQGTFCACLLKVFGSLDLEHSAEARSLEAVFVWDVMGQFWADVFRVLCSELDRT